MLLKATENSSHKKCVQSALVPTADMSFSWPVAGSKETEIYRPFTTGDVLAIYHLHLLFNHPLHLLLDDPRVPAGLLLAGKQRKTRSEWKRLKLAFVNSRKNTREGDRRHCPERTQRNPQITLRTLCCVISFYFFFVFWSSVKHTMCGKWISLQVFRNICPSLPLHSR